MSFSIYAAGTREQAAAQLKALAGNEASGVDSLSVGLAELLAEHVGKSELHGYETGGSGWRQQYIIEASGHSGPQSSLSLHVEVKAPYLPVADQAADELATELTTELIAEDGRKDEVLAAIDKAIAGLGFAAPETHADHLAQMREHVKGIFEPVDDEDDEVVDAEIDDDED